MTDKEKYLIKIQGKLIEVSEDVYYAYFHMERQERTQQEKKQRNEVMSYDALDNSETLGMENIADMSSPSMEEQAIASVYRIPCAVLESARLPCTDAVHGTSRCSACQPPWLRSWSFRSSWSSG